MKRRVIIFTISVVLIVIGMVAAFAGCDEYVKRIEPDASVSVDAFVVLDLGSYRIIIDKETGVEYLHYVISSATAITPLYNADGTLKVYKEEQE